jgi:hypothetical protein
MERWWSDGVTDAVSYFIEAATTDSMRQQQGKVASTTLQLQHGVAGSVRSG